MLDLAKAEAGISLLTWSGSISRRFSNEIEEMANALTEGTGVMFLLDIPLDLGRMHGDRLKLKQILLNLVGNAAKFTKQGRITLVVTDERSSIVFAVEDTGPGIPPDRLDSLFKAFSQVGGSNARGPQVRASGSISRSATCACWADGFPSAAVLGKAAFRFRAAKGKHRDAEPIPPARREDRLVIGHTESLGSLDPHLQMRSTNWMIARHHFEALDRDDGGWTRRALPRRALGAHRRARLAVSSPTRRPIPRRIAV